MTDEELLQSAGLILPDETALRHGVTRGLWTKSSERYIPFGKDRKCQCGGHILREIISNLLMHRDFSSGYVSKIVIEKNRILTENASLSHGHGLLQLATFDPYQKNPPIPKVFREIGLADELGSGMRSTCKYTRMYSGQDLPPGICMLDMNEL